MTDTQAPDAPHLATTLAFVGAKGGVGTSVTVLLTANHELRMKRPVRLVDLTGDLSVLLGVTDEWPGVTDLCNEFGAASSDTGAVHEKLLPINAWGQELQFLPRGKGGLDPQRTRSVIDGMQSASPKSVLIDAGRADGGLHLLAGVQATRVLVTGCDNQSVFHALRFAEQVDKMVVVEDPRLTLDAAGFVAAVGRQADACIPFDQSISRWADAGLLIGRGMEHASALEEL